MLGQASSGESEGSHLKSPPERDGTSSPLPELPTPKLGLVWNDPASDQNEGNSDVSLGNSPPELPNPSLGMGGRRLLHLPQDSHQM